MGWRSASCHPEREHVAKNLCNACYRAGKRRERGIKEYVKFNYERPECHPNNKYYAVGLCKRCYDNQKYTQIPAEIKLLWRVQKYGLTVDEFNQLKEQQGGTCKICFSDLNLEIDHDHSCCAGKSSCGKCVRGLICHSCNNLLKLAKDNKSILQSAILYLERAGV